VWHDPFALPWPVAAPLCPRLRATTNVLCAPIPMPLDILSDPYSDPHPTFWQRCQSWKAAHGAGHGTLRNH
jgi:hypothetical protein